MRLFIALHLGSVAEEQVLSVISHLRSHSLEGGFTRGENLHLTLAFLGEQGSLKQAADSVSALAYAPFVFTLQGLGRFRQSGGDLYWMGVSPCPPLEDLWRNLHEQLEQQGFRLDQRPFKPHLTLGRRVKLEQDFDWQGYGLSLPSLEIPVNRISVMESRRIQGRLTYTPRYTKYLEDTQ